MADSRPLLEVNAIETCYGLSQVLFGLSLAVAPGELVTLMGRNGMGKTTTVRSLMGLTPAMAGSVRFDGKEIRGLPAYRVAKLGIGLVPEGRQVFPNLTVAENLRVPVRRGVAAAEQRRHEELVYQLFPQLAELRNRIGGLLSGGERQMLALASAIVCAPQLLLIDELSLGLAPVVVDDLLRRLIEMRHQTGIAVLIVEQSAAVALQIADYGYIMENGKIVLDGTAERLRSHPDVEEFYLGRKSGENRSYRDVRQYRRRRRWYG